MSGGHWNYSGYKIKELLESIGNDDKVKERFPKLSSVFIKLGDILSEIEKDLDWDITGDSTIKNDTAFETNSIDKLSDVLYHILSPELRNIEEEINELKSRIKKLELRINKYNTTDKISM